MFWKKKKKGSAGEVWLYQIRKTPGLKFEDSNENDSDGISHKQSIRVKIHTHTQLYLSYNTHTHTQLQIYTDEALRVFGSLYCEDNVVTDLTVSGPEMTDFDPTYLTVDGFKVLGNLLGSNNRLTDLKLSDHIIDYDSGVALADGLSCSTTLKNITLWKDRINDETGYAIVSYILRIPSLQMINLGQNTLTVGGRDRIQALVSSYNPSIDLKMF